MDIVKMRGCTRVCGESQGFQGLPLIDETMDVEGYGTVHMMTSAWKPSIDDLMALNQGGTIRVRIWGTPHPATGLPVPAPMMLTVAEAEHAEPVQVQT